MRNNVIMTALALAMASTVAQAANISSAPGGGLWSATTTWTGGVVPGETVAVTDVARIVNTSLVTLNYTPTYALGNVQIGRTTGGAGNLEVTTGGVLNMTLGSNLEVGSQTVGTLLLSGGTVNVLSALNISAAATTTSGSFLTVNGGNLNVGTALAVGKFALGTLTINGGSVVANTMPVGAVGINSSASLLGGSLQLGALVNPLTFNSAGSTLTIANAATLTLGGNQNTAVAGFAGGNLLWNNGSSTLGGLYGTGDQTFDNGFGSYLHSFYDGGVNKTIVWVDLVPVPEPATLSLAVLGGIGLLAGRRMRRS